MTGFSNNRTHLAFLKGLGNNRYLVLTRNYGAILSIVLDDAETSPDCVITINSTYAAEFLEPFSAAALLPEFAKEYDAIQLYLSASNQPMLGLLSSARAALAMRELNLSVESPMQTM
jgi:hypothetical protein